MTMTKEKLVPLVASILGLLVGYLLPDANLGMQTEDTVRELSDNSMHDQMRDMSMGLEGKSGDEFDRAFLDEMIVHHEGAVQMARRVLETSRRPELRIMAQDIIDAQTTEIDQMERWKKEWFSN